MFLKSTKAPHKILNRLVIVNVVALIISAMIVSVTVYYLFAKSLRRNAQKEILEIERECARSYKDGGVSRLNTFVEEIFKLNSESDVYVALISSDSNEIYRYKPQSSSKRLAESDQFSKALEDKHLTRGWHTVLRPTGREQRNWFRRFEHDLKQYILKKKWIGLLNFLNFETADIHVSEVSKETWLQVGSSSHEREKILFEIRTIVLWVFIPAIALGAFLIFVFTGKALKPINQLISTIRRIDRGEVEVRAEVTGAGDEIDELASQFNQLMDSNSNLLKSIGQTLNGIAHDIRTPMTRFRIGAELGLKEPSNGEWQREALMDGIESAIAIDSLLTAILDAAESETETMVLHSEVIDLNKLLNQVADLFHYAFDEKNIELILNIDEKASIYGDATRLMQAFGNLIDNAIKYSPEGGWVKIEIRDGDSQVNICVTDNGVGISEDDLPKVWERLYRAENVRSMSGLGIGLSVVKSIIKAHGGEATITSQIGRGTSFNLTLPKIEIRTEATFIPG